MDDAIRQEMLALLPRLRRFAYGLTGSRDEGDDLVQATCERAISGIETWESGTRLDSWMYRIARNLYFNQLRAKRVRGEHLQLVDWDRQISFDGERAMDARLSFGSLRDFISRLPEEQREILLLVCVEGLAYKEVSQILGLPMGTVTSRLARARMTLKSFMAGADPIPDTPNDEGAA